MIKEKMEIKMQVKNVDYAILDKNILSRKDRTKVSARLFKHANILLMCVVMYFIAHVIVLGVL